MMWKIRGAISEVVCIEEWERVDQDRSRRDGYKKGDEGMARRMIAVSREGRGERMLRVEVRRVSSPMSRSVSQLEVVKKEIAYPRNG